MEVHAHHVASRLICCECGVNSQSPIACSTSLDGFALAKAGPQLWKQTTPPKPILGWNLSLAILGSLILDGRTHRIFLQRALHQPHALARNDWLGSVGLNRFAAAHRQQFRPHGIQCGIGAS